MYDFTESSNEELVISKGLNVKHKQEIQNKSEEIEILKSQLKNLNIESVSALDMLKLEKLKSQKFQKLYQVTKLTFRLQMVLFYYLKFHSTNIWLFRFFYCVFCLKQGWATSLVGRPDLLKHFLADHTKSKNPFAGHSIF